MRRATTRRSGRIEDSPHIVADSNNSHNHAKAKRRADVKPCVPKSLYGILTVLAMGLTCVLLDQLVAVPSSGGRGSGRENLDIEQVDRGIGDANSVVMASSRRARAPLPPVGVTSPTTNATLHIIFSTDCSPYQHWQSYLFFHTALKVRQPGYVTRIASGCSDEELQEEQAWHDEHIQSKMSERFRVHFTPRFSETKNEEGKKVDYKYNNKPFGLMHFLEHDDLLGLDAAGEMKRPDDIVILADPDFLLLRPLTDDFSDERETLVGPRRKSYYRKETMHVARRGHPYAQAYGMGTGWRKFDLDAIAGSDSPAKDISQDEGRLGYPAGPPYVVAAGDMLRLAKTWSAFAPRVYAQYPHLLAEMYAYCIAAAHLRLPHMLIDTMMVSGAGNPGEGWKLVEEVPAAEMCAFARNPDHGTHPVPSVIHYCQHYGIDKFFWGKRQMPEEIFTCEHPLLAEPPLDVGSGKYLSQIPPKKGGVKAQKEMSAEQERMMAFMLCALTQATNDAMRYFKSNHCEDGGNRRKMFDLWAGVVQQKETK